MGDWMRAAGMDVRRDAIGNLIGRYEGAGPRTLVLGSHLDTVRDAGRYDGPLGVLVALACVERLRARGERLPFAVELVGFADEEGLRFGTTYLGSSAYTGRLAAELLALEDAGRRRARRCRARPRRRPGRARARSGRRGAGRTCSPTSRSTSSRGRCSSGWSCRSAWSRRSRGRAGSASSCTGEAGHAGTVPDARTRRDALCAAAELILAVEATGRETAGLVATVGELDARPGAGNVVPGAVRPQPRRPPRGRRRARGGLPRPAATRRADRDRARDRARLGAPPAGGHRARPTRG